MPKKKVFFILNNFWIGGVERLIFDLIAGIRSQFSVGVISVLGTGPLETEFRKLSIPIYNTGLSAFSGKKIYFKLFWFIAAPVTFVRIILLFKKVKPMTVVTSLYQADVIGICAAWFCRIEKRIIIQHDVQRFGVLRKYVKSFLAFKCATLIIANSKATKYFLMSYWKINPEKIVIIRNGINVDRFKNVTRKNIGNKLVVGVVGRLEPMKGHRCFLEALAVLKKRYKIEPKVIVAGGGTLMQELKDYAGCQGLKVDFIGSTNDVPRVLQAIDILVVPSLEEGFGLVVLEGLVARKIVLASDIDAFRELIQSGATGVLFEKGNAEKLADILKKFIEHPDTLQHYYNNLDKWISDTGEQFDIKHVAENYSKLF